MPAVTACEAKLHVRCVCTVDDVTGAFVKGNERFSPVDRALFRAIFSNNPCVPSHGSVRTAEGDDAMGLPASRAKAWTAHARIAAIPYVNNINYSYDGPAYAKIIAHKIGRDYPNSAYNIRPLPDN